MYEEKNAKYYHIRANVFWIVIALIGILFIGTIFFTVNIFKEIIDYEFTRRSQTKTEGTFYKNRPC